MKIRILVLTTILLIVAFFAIYSYIRTSSSVIEGEPNTNIHTVPRQHEQEHDSSWRGSYSSVKIPTGSFSELLKKKGLLSIDDPGIDLDMGQEMGRDPGDLGPEEWGSGGDPYEDMEPGDPGRIDFSALQNVTDIPQFLYSVYHNDPREARDSAERCIDSLNFYIAEWTVPVILRVFGKHFYRLSYEQLHEGLMDLLITENRAAPDNSWYFERIPPTLSYLSENNSSYPYYQIWNNDYAFTIVNNTGSFSIDAVDIPAIPDYMYDIKYEYITLPAYQVQVPNYYDILQKILLEKDENDRMQLLFIYLLFLHSGNAIGYLENTTNAIAYEIEKSKTLDNYNKATWLVGCAKLLATIDPYDYSRSIFPYFKLAEGFLLLDKKNKEYLKKLNIIRSLWWNSLPGYHGKRAAGQILTRQYYENKDELSNLEKFKLLTYSAQVNLSVAQDLFLNNQPINSTLKLHIAANLSAASALLEYIRPNYFRADYSETLNILEGLIADYFFFNFQYDQAIEAQKKCIWMTLNEQNHDARYKLYGQIVRLNSLVALTDTCELEVWSDIIQLDPDNAFLKYSPLLDYRSFNPENYSNFKEMFFSINASEEIARLNWATVKYQEFKILRTVLERAAENEAEHRNWKEAYLLLDKADSFTYYFDPEFFMHLQASGSRSFYGVEKRNLQDSLSELRSNIRLLEGYQRELMGINDDLKDSNERLSNTTFQMNREIDDKKRVIANLDSIIVNKEALYLQEQKNRKIQEELAQSRKFINYMAFGFIGCLLLLFFLLGKNWVKRMMLSQTNNQLSHFAKRVPDIIGQRLRNAILLKDHESIENELRKLTMLGGFFDRFYEKSENEKNSLKDELAIFKSLANIEYNDQNDAEYVNERIVVNVDDSISDMKIPTFTVFNLLYNSFKWGGINKTSVGHVRIVVERRFLHYRITVLDNGFGMVQNEDSKESTGTKYVRLRIKFWNLLVLPRIYHGNRRDKQTGYEVSFSLISKL